jgi:DNA-binding transcriptional regulator YhcF (GntR family)
VKSTVGRPRRVTDEQVRIILAWYAELAELKARRKAVKTIRQLARELQLSTATISDVIRTHGVFKQPSPELREDTLRHRHARLSGTRNRRRRVSVLSDAQFEAIVQWRGETQALRRQMQCIPSKAQMAREMGVARGTLDRMIARAVRTPPGNVARGSLRESRLAAHQAQRLRAWQRERKLILEQCARLPSAAVFAGQLGISLAMLRRTLAGLNRRR